MTKITVFLAILCVLVALATLTVGDASPDIDAEGYRGHRCAIGHYYDGKRCVLRKKGSGPYKDGKFSGKAAEPGSGRNDGHDSDYGKKDQDYGRKENRDRDFGKKDQDFGRKDNRDRDFGKKDRDNNRDYRNDGHDGYGNYDRKHDNGDSGRRHGNKHD